MAAVAVVDKPPLCPGGCEFVLRVEGRAEEDEKLIGLPEMTWMEVEKSGTDEEDDNDTMVGMDRGVRIAILEAEVVDEEVVLGIELVDVGRSSVVSLLEVVVLEAVVLGATKVVDGAWRVVVGSESLAWVVVRWVVVCSASQPALPSSCETTSST